MGFAGQSEALGVGHVGLTEIVNFFGKGDGINDDAVADEIDDVVSENTGRNGVQNVFATIENERVSGVGATLKTGYYIVSGRQKVHYFALAFIAPLEAQENIYCHKFLIISILRLKKTNIPALRRAVRSDPKGRKKFRVCGLERVCFGFLITGRNGRISDF